METVKKMILTEEEVKACEIVYSLYYSDDDIFCGLEDLDEFLNTVTAMKYNQKSFFKSMEIEVEE